VSANASEANYLTIASVVVPGAPVSSADYTVTDLRNSLTTVTRREQVGMAPSYQGAGWALGLTNGWTSGASSTNPIEFELPVNYGRDVRPNDRFHVYVYMGLADAADDAAVHIYQRDIGGVPASYGSVASVAAVIGAPGAGWVKVSVGAFAYSHLDRLSLGIIPASAVGGNVQILHAYKERTARYMGP
jgi:hypothetical protein